MTMDKLIVEILKGCEHDGSYIPVTEVKRLMQSYHEAKLKEELFAFNSWMCRNQYDGRIPLIDTCIDEYLKSK